MNIYGNDPSLEVIHLSGDDWFIRSDRFPSASEWIPATVPGNIQSDLEAALLLNPLWYGIGDRRMEDVPNHDWYYRKEFYVPQYGENVRMRLVFDGVDHECEVYLNGTCLGKNSGMFKRFGFDVEQHLRYGNLNELCVRISGIPEKIKDALPPYHDLGGLSTVESYQRIQNELKGLKSATNTGWDWAVPIYTLGIWKDVRLEPSGYARIDWARVTTHLPSHDRAIVQVQLEVHSTRSDPVLAKVMIEGNGTILHSQATAALQSGNNTIVLNVTVDHPALWWPNGHGEQPLYKLTSQLASVGSNEQLHVTTTRFGIREIRWEQLRGIPEDFINPTQLVINGRPIRMMGSNLLPPDLLFGRMNERGPKLLHLAHRAGINTLRVWGGGVILTESLYDLADELGIMLFQEFVLANIWPDTDPVFLENYSTTMVNIVKQIRNHPCIVEWSGGNEMPWEQGTVHEALQRLERIVEEHDDRIFRATDPIQGWGKHGTYSYVYHHEPAPYLSWLGGGGKGEVNLYQAYNDREQMRLGEFGTNSPANLEVWHREIPPQSQWPLSDQEDPVLIRKNVFWGALIAENWLHKEIIERLFGTLNKLGDLVEAGQFLAAEGLRYAMDELRRNGDKLGGFMSWNYNEPWPNGAGSYMVDYDGRPLMNYDYVKQALQPISLSLKYDSLLYQPEEGLAAQIWLVSDAPQTVDSIKWRCIARNQRGQVLETMEGDASIHPREVLELGKIEGWSTVKGCEGPLLVETQLFGPGDELIAERLYVFQAEGERDPLRTLLYHQESCRTELHACVLKREWGEEKEILVLSISNTGAKTAFFCEPHPLLEYRTDVFIADNHIFIPPGEGRTITIEAPNPSEGGLSLLQTGWRITCWNADDVTIPPSNVLFSMGRRDQTCREYRFYPQPSERGTYMAPILQGSRIEPAEVPFLVDSSSGGLTFKFNMEEEPPTRARLRLHTADRSREGVTVTFLLNETHMEHQLPGGLGIQDKNPPHLASPSTLEVELQATALIQGDNVLVVSVGEGGWFTWDALELVNA